MPKSGCELLKLSGFADPRATIIDKSDAILTLKAVENNTVALLTEI